MVKGKPVCEYAPKRPLSAYFLFAADVRTNIMDKNPDMLITEVMSKIGEEWSELSDRKKSPYQIKADKAKEVYSRKLEKYKKTAHYTKHQAALAEWKKTQASKPFKKDPNRPKRGLSAYLIFVNEKRQQLMSEGHSMVEVAKVAAKMWGKMTGVAKAPYEKKSEKSKAEAAKAFEKYQKTRQYKSYMAEKEEYDAKRKERMASKDGEKKVVAKK